MNTTNNARRVGPSAMLEGAASSKQSRADQANRLIEAIAGCGRRFFFHNGVISGFSVDRAGKVWFVDSYSGRRVYTHDKGPWRGFTNGGTMRTLIERLRDYIRTGTPQTLNLGPWPAWVCDGDLWGYGDEMQKVRDAAATLGLVPSNTELSRRADGGA